MSADAWTGYLARCDALRETLEQAGPNVPARELARLLEWSPHEVRAKLMHLRSEGRATYDGGTWSAA